MRHVLGGLALAVLMLGLTARDAEAADAKVKYVVTNGGVAVAGYATVYFVSGGHDGKQAAWSSSGDTATIPAGAYDVHVVFEDGSAKKDFWIDNQSFSGSVTKTVEIHLPITEVRYQITNAGADVKGSGQVHYVVHGNHDGEGMGWASSDDPVRMPAGAYDVHVTWSDGSASKDYWIDNQNFPAGKVNKTTGFSQAVTEVRYTITNNGVDVKGNGQVHYVVHGNHDGADVAWAGSDDPVRIPVGTYDVHVNWSDGSASKDYWIDNQAFAAGKVNKTTGFGQALTDVRTVITNNGVDVKGNGQAHYVVAGNHGGADIAWASSGEPVRLPVGAYDVHVTWSDGSANKDLWIDNQTFTGSVTKTVEIGVNVTEVRYLLTNGGVDVKGNGQAHYVVHGNHDGADVAWASSGDPVRIPNGTYDVHVNFEDGSAKKDFWIDNQAFSGKVDKTVEIGLPVADVTYVLVNLGADLKDKAQAHYYPAGHHDGGGVAWAVSGEKQRLAAGAYDVQAIYDEGLVHKVIWLNNQNFTGTVKNTVDFKVVLAWPTVSVTQNGKDVGDQATVDYLDPTNQTDFGKVHSGETATVEQGTYDIHAWLGEADGWLRKQKVSGKPHFTIAVAMPTTATLKAGAPPPKACAIEVYGVNFDFNKATLRPDSEPMLKQVLALFTGTPSFSAEVSGHTDNIGTSDYNMKLSGARAAAVKAWLVAHGVSAARVSSRGYGDTRPLVPNDNDADRFKNRRVELRRTNCR
jgi:outer membrane protein OmpA-like peptidoglycan-associated protein